MNDQSTYTAVMIRCVLACIGSLLLCSIASAQTGSTPQRPTPGSQQSVMQTFIDSVYMPGGRVRIDTVRRRDTLTATGRLRRDLRLDSLDLIAMLDSLDNTVQARMRRNLMIDPSEWMPTQADRDRREHDLRQAMDMDFVFPNSYVKLFGISTGAVFRALGLIEDVTPRINYTLMRTDHVVVKIYDMRAELVRTIVDATQSPGVYDFQWDLLDSAGRRVPYGNYIGEVIVGKTLVLRKRIEAP